MLLAKDARDPSSLLPLGSQSPDSAGPGGQHTKSFLSSARLETPPLILKDSREMSNPGPSLWTLPLFTTALDMQSQSVLLGREELP